MPVFAVFYIPDQHDPIARLIARGPKERINYAAVDRLVGHRQCISGPSQDWHMVTAPSPEEAIKKCDVPPPCEVTMPHKIAENWQELSEEMTSSKPQPVGIKSLRRVLGLGYGA